jgi:lipopolysaccharide biosynthesis regulator YciM
MSNLEHEDNVAELERASHMYQLGRDQMASGDYTSAIESFRAGLDASPHFKTLELLGECLVRVGRLREAIVPLAAVTTLNGQVRAPSMLAKVFLDLGDRVNARRIARLALGRAPTNRLTLEVLAATEDLAEDWD